VNFEQLLFLAQNKTRIVSDSREVRPGDIFVALPGTKVDGASFIPEALAKGAKYVLSSSKEMLSQYPKQVVYHSDPRRALGELAKRYYFPQGRKIKLLGVTGTNGKTTTCFLLKHLLQSAGYKTGVLGTVEISWPGYKQKARQTTPDCLDLHATLAKMEAQGVEVACLEVSSHALDQDRIAGLEFDVGIFTNLTQDHLDYHKDLPTYFQAKAKLFRQYTKRAVINGDCSYGREILQFFPGPKVSFGLNDDNDFRILKYLLNLKGMQVELLFRSSKKFFELKLLGKFNLYNALAALGGASFLGLDLEVLKGLETFMPPPGRMEKITNSKELHVIVDYAHTPDALANVTQTLKELTTGKLIVVFGCGGNRDRQKRPLMAKAVARYADVVVVTSDNPRFEEPMDIIGEIVTGFEPGFPYYVEPDRKQAIALGLSLVGREDILLIAGKGHEDYQEIKGKKIYFSDQDVVRELLG